MSQMATPGTLKVKVAGVSVPVPFYSMPPGVMAMWPAAATSPPAGWLLCDGQSVPVATYPSLHAVIGYTYGGAGANFTLPNLKGRVPVGLDAAQTEFNTLAKTGGAKTVTLSTTTMPSHNHDPTSAGWGTGYDSPDHQHAQKVTAGTAGGTGVRLDYVGDYGGAQAYPQGIVTDGATARHVHTVAAQGGGAAHENMPPYQVVNYIVKF